MSRVNEPRSVAMILNSPGYGGVPHVVNAIVSGLDRRRFTPSIYFLKGFSQTQVNKHERWRELATRGISMEGACEKGGKIGVVTQLTSWLKQKNIDIIHTHSFRPNLYGRMAGALCRSDGLAIVSHYHNQYDDKWLDNPASLELEQHLAPVTDAMIAVTESVRRHVSARVGVDIHDIDVIGNGVDLARFARADADAGRRVLGIESGEFCIGLVGRVCHQKGIDLFVQSAIQISSRLPQARFIIIGDIEDQLLYTNLQACIASSGLQGVIRFTGHINDPEPLFAALDLLVAPSRWEGFGLMLVEAMAAGVPIIASRIDAIEDVTGNGMAARLFAAEDLDALIIEIESIVANGSMRDSLVRAGRERAEDFSWHRSVDAVASVYDRLSGTCS